MGLLVYSNMQSQDEKLNYKDVYGVKHEVFIETVNDIYKIIFNTLKFS